MNSIFRYTCIYVCIYLLFAQDPSKTIKKITAFLGLSMSDGEINQIAWKTSFTEMKNNTAKENCDRSITWLRKKQPSFPSGELSKHLNTLPTNILFLGLFNIDLRRL